MGQQMRHYWLNWISSWESEDTMKFGLNVVLLVLSLVCFAVKFFLGLFGGSSGKLDLDALGMCFLVASFIFA